MKKTPIIVPETPIKITGLAISGEGTATVSDRNGYFWNTLPGELVTEYRLVKNRKNSFIAIATKLDNLSPDRIEPKDEQYLATSPWQILSEKAENEQKLNVLKNLYKNCGDFNSETINFTESPKNYYYRNKMEYTLYYSHEDELIHLAVHARGSHQKIIIKNSSIEIPAIFDKAQEIVAELNRAHDEARRYQSLLLRANQEGKVSGGLYENHQPHPKFDLLEDTLLGQKYSYSPNGFFQINLPVYELVLKRIRKLIGNSTKVLDLYSGVGTIGLSVARDKDLTLVELDKSAYKELEKNAKIASKDNPNIKPIYARSEDALEYITPDSVVILDPPRAGCHAKLIEKLNEIKPTKIIYLSCNPVTQAHNISELLTSYKLETIEGFNFFPRTPHIESLAVLTPLQ